MSKYPDAKRKSHSARLHCWSAPKLLKSGGVQLTEMITSHLDVWRCVATRKDKVLSFTAVKVAPCFSSFFSFLCFTEIICFYGIIFVSNYIIAQQMNILFGEEGTALRKWGFQPWGCREGHGNQGLFCLLRIR